MAVLTRSKGATAPVFKPVFKTETTRRTGCGGARGDRSRHVVLSKKRIWIVVASAAACAPLDVEPPGLGKNGATSTPPTNPSATSPTTSAVAVSVVART